MKLSKWTRNAKNVSSNQQTRQYIFFIAKNIYIMNQSIQHEKVEQPKRYDVEEKNDLVEVKENKESEEEAPLCKTCPSSTLVTPKKIPFWAENPNVLLQQPYVLEFFPTEDMTFYQKLNAITRLVLVLTTISYLYTKKFNLIVVSVVSILCIYLMFYANQDAKKEEGFQNKPLERSYDRNGPISDMQPAFEETFEKVTAQNPLSNVMVSDYDYHPHKKPAPPAYTKEGKKVILEETKKMIQQMHPEHENIDKKLFQDATDNLELEQSMRQFYSTANTTIPNDQASFAEFCYGDMISNKEGNMFAAVRNNPRHNLY